MEYDKEFSHLPKSNFEIIGNHFYTFIDDKKVEREILILSECSFELKSQEIIDETKMTELQKVLNRQKPYFDIIKVEENVYYFVCRIDLHVISYSGKFIRSN